MRPDIERAWQHLVESFPLENAPDPIGAFRLYMDRYGAVDDWSTRPRGRRITVADAPWPAEWLAAAEARPDHRIVYLHGGAWIAGSLDSHRDMAMALSRASGAAVLLPDYRLAPEHPFPAGLDDAVAAIGWAWATGPEGPAAAAAVTLAGDSAGANLAAAACLEIAARGARLPTRLALLCPVLDVTAGAPRTPTATTDPDIAALATVMGLYAGTAARDDPRLSPLLAPGAAMAAFPPTLIHASAADFLLADAERFLQRLQSVGVAATMRCWPDLPHVWHAFLGLLPEAEAALAEVGAFLSASGDPART